MSYHGLLVDYGGVLTTSLFDSFGAFCAAEGLAPEALMQRFRTDKAARELLIGLETGRIDEDEFEPALAQLLGVPAPSLIDRLFAGSGPEQPMVHAVLTARDAGIRTGLISNSWGTRRYDREQLAKLFDGVVISGEEGMRKPTPAMYTLGAERIGVAPEQCVYVDDLPFNLKPAEELGMATIHHTDPQRTVDELERLLGVPLR
ncbi:MAG TPA: HAD family phosphatase [Solirubrobacteraceae bacterium]|jgi:epoxide hydrolase-like predicted phosphatase|nr:HAD family phosphatase [Solirubrobacteraceae bacterium]